MRVEKVSDSGPECVVLDSDNSADKINQLETPHGRANRRNGALTGAAQSNLRSELWKLMCISPVARPGAIYDASATEETFTDGK